MSPAERTRSHLGVRLLTDAWPIDNVMGKRPAKTVRA